MQKVTDDRAVRLERDVDALELQAVELVVIAAAVEIAAEDALSRGMPACPSREVLTILPGVLSAKAAAILRGLAEAGAPDE